MKNKIQAMVELKKGKFFNDFTYSITDLFKCIFIESKLKSHKD